MKRILFRVFFIIFLAFVLPVAAAHYKNMAETTEKIHIVNNVENNLDVQNSDTKNAKNDEPPASPAKNDGTPSRTITVLIHGDVHEMTLEDYTAGALAAEMPAKRRRSPRAHLPSINNRWARTRSIPTQQSAPITRTVPPLSIWTPKPNSSGAAMPRRGRRKSKPPCGRQTDRS